MRCHADPKSAAAQIQRRTPATDGPSTSTMPPPELAARDGLPTPLRANLEAMSGFSLADVRVHRDSPEPAKLGALAFARGSDIHLGPGQQAHLPHEAWHVVQQKQGRVRVTQQKQGVGVNQDRALEAEADEAGGRLGVTTRPSTAALHDVQAPPEVVQGMLLSHSKSLKPAEALASPRIRELDASLRIYHLRDDWKPSQPDDNLHLLLDDRKYLLGERHQELTATDDTKWNEDTKLWSSIAKAEERIVAVPSAAVRMQSSHAEGVFPLENQDARLLGTAVLLQSLFNKICEPHYVLSAQSYESDFIQLNRLREFPSAAELYGAYCDGSPLPLLRGVDKLRCLFGAKLEKIYVPSALETGLIAKQISDLGKSKGFHFTAKDHVLLEKYYSDLNVKRQFFMPMITDLLELNDVEPRSNRARLIGEAIRSPSPDAAVAAVRPVRDRWLEDNLLHTPAPLLARLGFEHLDGMAAHDPSAVKVPPDKSLEEFTAWEKGIARSL